MGMDRKAAEFWQLGLRDAFKDVHPFNIHLESGSQAALPTSAGSCRSTDFSMSRGPPMPTLDNLHRVSVERLRTIEDLARERAFRESVDLARKTENKENLERKYLEYIDDRKNKESERRKKLEEDKFELRQRREQWLRERHEREARERAETSDNKKWRRTFWEEERAAKQNSSNALRERGRADLRQTRIIDKRWRDSLDELRKEEVREKARIIEENSRWRRQVTDTIQQLQSVRPAVMSDRMSKSYEDSELNESYQDGSHRANSPRKDGLSSMDGSS